MAGVELANAYVTLVPSAAGIASKLSEEMGAPLEDAATKSGEKTSSSWGKAFGIGVAAAGVAVVAGLAKIGSDFDNATDTIRTNTGATNEVLDTLKGSFENVVKAVPADFGDASGAISVLYQKLGLTDKPLEDLAGQVLNLSRITGTDLNTNVEAAASLFLNWGTTAAEQGPKLDELFRVSQATGVSVSDLATGMAEGGVAFRQAGLSFEDSASILGLLSANGLAAGDITGALGKAMAVAAKDGSDANTVFRNTFDAIKNAPDDASAAAAAFEVFGAKAGPKFAALVREGKLSYEDMAASITAGGDTISAASDDTADWQEKLTLLKNRALVSIAPVAERVFNGIGDVITKIQPTIEKVTTWVGENLPIAMAAVSDFVKTHWPPIRDVIVDALDKIRNGLTTVRDWVVEHWPQIHAVISEVFDKVKAVIGVIVNDVLPGLVSGIKSALGWLMDNKEFLIGAAVAIGIVLVGMFVSWAIEAAAAAIATIAAFAPLIVAGVIVAAFVGGIIYAYNHFEIFRTVVNAVKDALLAAWAFISTYLIPIFQTLIETYIKILVVQFKILWEVITTVIDIFKEIVGFIIDHVVPAFGDIITKITEVASWIGEKVADIVGFVTGIPARIKDSVTTMWGDLKLSIVLAKQWVGEKIDDIVTFATDLPGKLAGKFAGMWDGIKDAFKAAINFLIRMWNGLRFTLPKLDLGPLGEVGGWTVGTNHIDEFHGGGVSAGGPAVLSPREMVLTGTQQARLFAIANGATGGGAPIVVNNYRRDIGVADLNQILAMARLAS